MKKKLFLLFLFCFGFLFTASALADAIKVLHIYTGKDNHSHFDYIQIPLKNTDKGLFSDKIPLKSMLIVKRKSDFTYDYHDAPGRQYVVVIGGKLEVAIGNDKRILNTGDILLAEDTTGTGHISRSVGNDPCITLFAQIP